MIFNDEQNCLTIESQLSRQHDLSLLTAGVL